MSKTRMCGSCKAAGGRLGIPPPFLAFLAVAAALAFVAPEAAHEEARFGITWHEARVWALSKRELLHIMAKQILGSSTMNHKFFFCEWWFMHKMDDFFNHPFCDGSRPDHAQNPWNSKGSHSFQGVELPNPKIQADFLRFCDGSRPDHAQNEGFEKAPNLWRIHHAQNDCSFFPAQIRIDWKQEIPTWNPTRVWHHNAMHHKGPGFPKQRHEILVTLFSLGPAVAISPAQLLMHWLIYSFSNDLDSLGYVNPLHPQLGRCSVKRLLAASCPVPPSNIAGWLFPHQLQSVGCLTGKLGMLGYVEFLMMMNNHEQTNDAIEYMVSVTALSLRRLPSTSLAPRARLLNPPRRLRAVAVPSGKSAVGEQVSNWITQRNLTSLSLVCFVTPRPACVKKSRAHETIGQIFQFCCSAVHVEWILTSRISTIASWLASWTLVNFIEFLFWHHANGIHKSQVSTHQLGIFPVCLVLFRWRVHRVLHKDCGQSMPKWGFHDLYHRERFQLLKEIALEVAMQFERQLFCQWHSLPGGLSPCARLATEAGKNKMAGRQVASLIHCFVLDWLGRERSW